MNENQAFVFCIVVAIISIIIILFFKHKYLKQSRRNNNFSVDNLTQIPTVEVSQENTQSSEKEISQENIEKQVNELSKEDSLIEQIKSLTIMNEELSQDNESFKNQLEKYQAIVNHKDTQEQSHILVVDDSLVVRNKIKKLLEQHNYLVTTANDGLEALGKIESQVFSLVITDLEMPQLDGLGLIKHISTHEQFKDLPVIAITGHEDIHLQVSEGQNFYGVQKKPWDDATLLRKIKNLT